MVAVFAGIVLLILVWAWWFDRYRRRPRRGAGRIDDTALERDRSLANRHKVNDHHVDYGGGGGGFGG